MLTNLLNNAAKYTEEGGQILAQLRQQEGDRAVIRVRDTGIGIPPQMLQSVFELFTQVDQALDRSTGGLGIGLTLVKRLVEMHDGSVETPVWRAGTWKRIHYSATHSRHSRKRSLKAGRSGPQERRVVSTGLILNGSWWSMTTGRRSPRTLSS